MKVNIKKYKVLLFFLISFFVITALILLMFSKINKDKSELSCSAQKQITENTDLNKKEMRAVWVTFMDLSMKDTDYSENAFKKKFDKIVSDCKKLKMNTLIVHVRPFSDALYKSKYFPWSHIVSKKQGDSPGYDPLDYMVKKSHEEGLEIHAWINPFRIQLNSVPSILDSSNPFLTLKNKKRNDLTVDFGTSKYLNPCSKEVQNLIIDGVKELAKGYKIDGIHFDDYFYPELPKKTEKLNAENFDDSDYESYCKSLDSAIKPLTHRVWRMENINSLIKRVYKEIKNINPKMVFGISPCCNNEVNYRIGADVYTWCKNEGYIDYICPQIYVSLDHPVLPFKKSADEWKGIVKNKNIKLYYGLAVYKAGSKTVDSGTWGNSNDILKKQIEYVKSLGCDGYMFFDYQSLVGKQGKEEVKNMLEILD